MEDEKRKKKNKKKKNKQQVKSAAVAAADTASSNAGETSSVGTLSGEQDNVLNMVIDEKHVHNANGGCAAVDTDSEKQPWLREEARLRDMVKQLLYEKDSYIHKQADLEMRMNQLQSENSSLHQKEMILEQRISQLLQENAALSFEEMNMLEKFQHAENEKLLLVDTEKSSKESMATLNNENARLRTQVLELEGARNSLLQDNKQLLDNISTLQSRVQDLEMSLRTVVSPPEAQKDVKEIDILNAELEGTYALIGKLMTENAELVEKVNVLSMELGQLSVVPDVISVDVPDHSTADPVPSSIGDIQEDERMKTDEMVSNYATVVRHSADAILSGEIVQIPLDENESQDLEAQASVNADAEIESVPLADAPLIGAPYRLISFVAKYVSGADLVDKGSPNSLQ